MKTQNNSETRLVFIVLALFCALCAASRTTLKVAKAHRLLAEIGLTNNPEMEPQLSGNKPPLLVYENPQAVLLGGSLIVRPKLGLTDNGTVANLLVGVTPSGFTGLVTVDSDGVVTIADAGAVGAYTVTVSATDNEGANTLARFSLRVTSAPCLHYEFAPGAPFPVSNRTRFLATGDFNEDNQQDIARANNSFGGAPDDVEIFLGNGNGGFTSIGQIAGTGSPWEIDVCDFNRDNHQDLIMETGGGFLILLGDGNGGFSHHAQSPFDIPGTSSTADMSIADFNGDGRVDIAIGTSSSPLQMYIYLNHSSLGIIEANNSPINFSTYPREIETGDFNKDGNSDIVVLFLAGGDRRR